MPQLEGECWKWKLPTYYDSSLFILIVILFLFLSILVYRFLLFKPKQSYETITSNKNFISLFRSLFSTNFTPKIYIYI
jgi:ABC-type antimicrobial peptide transport system permease subunit